LSITRAGRAVCIAGDSTYNWGRYAGAVYPGSYRLVKCKAVMSALFRIVPTTLFQPLSAPGAAIYAEILLAIFNQARLSNQLLSRELTVDLVAERLTGVEQALELTRDADAGDPDPSPDDTEQLRVRALAIVRYLERCGWLRPETQSDFTQSFILPDYAFRLLETLDRIALNDPPPLRGLILSIHDLLQSALRSEHPGDLSDRVAEAHRQTMLLINGLRELQHNIGVHINAVLEEVEARQILERVFVNYRQDIVDRAYHQLRTTDHVSRFRPGIIDAAAQIERMTAASTTVLEQVFDIRNRFDILDNILQAIDERHSQFMDAAARAIELHLTTTSTTSGQLNAILKALLVDRRRDAPALSESLLSLFRMRLVDEASLSAPMRAATTFVPETIEVDELTLEEEEAAREETLRQMQRAVSRKQVRRWVDTLLYDRESLRGADIPLEGPEQLPLLIYLRAYGQDGALGYRIEEVNGGGWIEREGVGFRDFVIRRVDEAEEEIA